MISKIIICIFLLIIFFCLGSALRYMLLRKENAGSMTKALTWRIGLSVGLFVLLIVGAHMGLVQPHGLSDTKSTSKVDLHHSIT